MRRRVLTALALLAIGAVTTDPSTDLRAKMQGTWEATTILDGMGKDPPAEMSLTVHGDWFTLDEHGNRTPAIITVDASRSPTTFVCRGLDNPNLAGVIEVKGDHLTIAFCKVGRPAKSFDAAAGKIVMTFKRAAAAATRPAATRP